MGDRWSENAGLCCFVEGVQRSVVIRLAAPPDALQLALKSGESSKGVNPYTHINHVLPLYRAALKPYEIRLVPVEVAGIRGVTLREDVV